MSTTLLEPLDSNLEDDEEKCSLVDGDLTNTLELCSISETMKEENDLTESADLSNTAETSPVETSAPRLLISSNEDDSGFAESADRTEKAENLSVETSEQAVSTDLKEAPAPDDTATSISSADQSHNPEEDHEQGSAFQQEMGDSSESSALYPDTRPLAAVRPIMATGADGGASDEASQHSDTEKDAMDKEDSPEAEPPTSSVQKQELDILLIGKTGHGKSATGNSILQRRAFETSTRSESVTFDVQEAYAHIDEYVVKVVDGPGVGETRLNNVEATTKACRDMAEAMSRCADGFHALLLVLKFGNRYTEEEQDAIQMLKGIFGEDIVRDYCIIIITHGEQFDMEFEEEGDFSQWLSEQTGALKKLFIECKYRVVLLRNKTKDPAVKRDQLLQLLQMVRSLKHRDVRYTNEHFERVKKQRDQLEVESKAPQLNTKIMKETNLIISDLTRLRESDDDLDGKDTILLRLEEIVKNLLVEIQEEDRGTGVLNGLRDTVARVDESIRMEKAVNAQRKEDRRAQEKLIKEHEVEILGLKKEHAEEKRKLEEQLRTAEDEERQGLVKRLEEINADAKDREERMNRVFEEKMLKATQEEAQKWKEKLEEISSEHNQKIAALELQYKEMNEQTTESMTQRVQSLTDQLVALQRKKAPPKDPSKVTLYCKDQEGRAASATILKSEPIDPVMRAYCGLSGYEMGPLRFMYDGRRVQPGDTPIDLGLQDEEMIEVSYMQLGG